MHEPVKKVSHSLNILIPLVQKSMAYGEILPAKTTKQFLLTCKSKEELCGHTGRNRKPFNGMYSMKGSVFIAEKQGGPTNTLKNNLITDKIRKNLYLRQNVEGISLFIIGR